MSRTTQLLSAVDAVLIAINEYQALGGDIGKLMALRDEAKAQGRDLNTEEITKLANEADEARDDLQDALNRPAVNSPNAP